jgi:hypothetical protein
MRDESQKPAIALKTTYVCRNIDFSRQKRRFLIKPRMTKGNNQQESPRSREKTFFFEKILTTIPRGTIFNSEQMF